MKISHAGILSILTIAVAITTSCSVINKVRARDALNDGARAYKDRKFDLAEERFTQAMSLDPNQKMTEVFLARTLHQQYLAKRDSPENMKKAQQAIEIYKKILSEKPDDRASNDAVTNLILNLNGPEAQEAWVRQRAEDSRVSGDGRAEAYTLLASKQYTCANEITELPDVKQTVQKGKEAVYTFKKPANAADFEKAKQCTQNGLNLIDKAIALDDNNDSTWSYRTSLLVQAARIAEMEGNTAEKDRLTAESNKAKERFLQLSKEKALKQEAEDKKKAEAEAEK